MSVFCPGLSYQTDNYLAHWAQNARSGTTRITRISEKIVEVEGQCHVVVLGRFSPLEVSILKCGWWVSLLGPDIAGC